MKYELKIKEMTESLTPQFLKVFSWKRVTFIDQIPNLTQFYRWGRGSNSHAMSHPFANDLHFSSLTQLNLAYFVGRGLF